MKVSKYKGDSNAITLTKIPVAGIEIQTIQKEGWAKAYSYITKVEGGKRKVIMDEEIKEKEVRDK